MIDDILTAPRKGNEVVLPAADMFSMNKQLSKHIYAPGMSHKFSVSVLQPTGTNIPKKGDTPAAFTRS